MSYSNPYNRRWKLFYVAGMPAQMCCNGHANDLRKVVANIQEEWEGQKANILAWAEDEENPAKPGDTFSGQRFVLVCTR
jgi:hypothetical protein